MAPWTLPCYSCYSFMFARGASRSFPGTPTADLALAQQLEDQLHAVLSAHGGGGGGGDDDDGDGGSDGDVDDGGVDSGGGDW